jgi:hypothetical protein
MVHLEMKQNGTKSLSVKTGDYLKTEGKLTPECCIKYALDEWLATNVMLM